MACAALVGLATALSSKIVRSGAEKVLRPA